MPVRKLTTLKQAEESCWLDPDDPALVRTIAAVWAFARAVAPKRYPPGVYKSTSIEEAAERAARWEG
jgi:hypothetical protein